MSVNDQNDQGFDTRKRKHDGDGTCNTCDCTKKVAKDTHDCDDKENETPEKVSKASELDICEGPYMASELKRQLELKTATSEASEAPKAIALEIPNTLSTFVFVCTENPDMILRIQNKRFVVLRKKVEEAFVMLKDLLNGTNRFGAPQYTTDNMLQLKEYDVTLLFGPSLHAPAVDAKRTLMMAHGYPQPTDGIDVYSMIEMCTALMNLGASHAIMCECVAKTLQVWDDIDRRRVDYNRVFTILGRLPCKTLEPSSPYQVLLHAFLMASVNAERLFYRTTQRGLVNEKVLDGITLPREGRNDWFDSRRYRLALMWNDSDKEDMSEELLLSVIGRSTGVFVEKMFLDNHLDLKEAFAQARKKASKNKDENKDEKEDESEDEDSTVGSTFGTRYYDELSRSFTVVNVMTTLLDIRKILIQSQIIKHSEEYVAPSSWSEFVSHYGDNWKIITTVDVESAESDP